MRIESFLPLTALALSIDPFWSIEPNWAMRAKGAMDTIDVGIHSAEFAAMQPLLPHGTDADAGDDGDEYRGEDGRDRDQEERKPYRLVDGVAYLYLTGPLTKRPQSWGGGTSTVLFRRQVRNAVADSAVKAILIVIDSPGGQVSGTGDAAADVAWASTKKPVAVFCEDLCCSAAYWIGCQAGYGMFCNPTATVGSIGTISVLVDSSRAAAEAGIKMHVVTTGDRKGIGVPGAPVTEEQVAYVHDYLDLINSEFTSSVQRSRKLSEETMTEVMRGGVYVGVQAVEIGLCCGVHRLDEVHAMLIIGADGEAESGRPAGRPHEPASEPALRAMPEYGRPAGRPCIPGLETIKMKEKLVQALTLLGLRKMAVAVVSANDDSPETMATAMGEQVNAEVAERVASHPLVLQCEAAGIKSATDFARWNEEAILGRAHLAALRADAKSQANRAFGAEVGPTIGAQVDQLSAVQVKSLLAAWSAQADAAFGIGKDGSAPARATAPTRLNESLPATGANDGKSRSAWDNLTEDQRAMGLRMGMNTPEKQEAYAREVLG